MISQLTDRLHVVSAGIIPASEIDKLPQGNSAGIAEAIRLATVFGAVIAVIVIIIAGIQFILSQGEPNKVATARNSIIYALIGLVICIFAGAITSYVIVKAGGA